MEHQKKLNDIMTRSGINLWGTCDFAPLAQHLLACRAKERLPAGAASVLCAAFPYRREEAERNVSHYAVPPDYHDVLVPLLRAAAEQLAKAFPSYRFEAFADNSPIPEVHAAALCGLGVVGDHGLLITPEYGSWVFLGEIVTDQPLRTKHRELEGCLHCGRCRADCPGGALNGQKLEKGRCLSHLTQKKGALTEEETALVQNGELIWGCDRCQEACPLNRGKKETEFIPFLQDRIPVVHTGDAARLQGRAFGWRPPGVIERNLKLLREKK